MASDSGGPKIEMKPHMDGARAYHPRPRWRTSATWTASILPEADARIPVLDRGFLFGDSIYEVVRTEGGVPFAWPEHWARW
jgi:hypothetical protein